MKKCSLYVLQTVICAYPRWKTWNIIKHSLKILQPSCVNIKPVITVEYKTPNIPKSHTLLYILSLVGSERLVGGHPTTTHSTQPSASHALPFVANVFMQARHSAAPIRIWASPYCHLNLKCTTGWKIMWKNELVLFLLMYFNSCYQELYFRLYLIFVKLKLCLWFFD